MNNFNAKTAKEIVGSLNNDELHNILLDIKALAEKGKTEIHIYKPISKATGDELSNRGFEVVNQPSIAIQKDNLHHSVYWR